MVSGGPTPFRSTISVSSSPSCRTDTMFKFFIFCYSFPFCERAVGSKETTIVPFSDYYFNTITLSVQESRGRRGIPPLEPLLPRRPSGEAPPSLRLRDSAERLNKIFFFLN